MVRPDRRATPLSRPDPTAPAHRLVRGSGSARVNWRSIAGSYSTALGLVALAAAWLWWAQLPAPEFGRLLFGRFGTRAMAFAAVLLWLALLCAAGRRSRRAAFAVVFATVLVAMPVLVLEVLGRVGAVRYDRLFGLGAAAPLGSARVPNQQLRGQAQQDIAALWSLPAAAIEFEYRTDQHGFRNAANRESADIYCLGDSYVVAGLLPFAQTLTAQLEQALRRAVMNIALTGLGTQERRELWRSAGRSARDAVVLHFVTEDNDLVDSARARGTAEPGDGDVAKSFVGAVTVWLQRQTQPVPGQARARVAQFAGEPMAFAWDQIGFAGLSAELEPTLAALGALHEEIAAAGGRHLVVLIPSKLRVLGPLCTWAEGSIGRELEQHLGPLAARLREFCAAREIPLLDLTDALSACAKSGVSPWFPLDTHWNARGHAVVAQALAQWPALREVPAARPGR